MIFLASSTIAWIANWDIRYQFLEADFQAFKSDEIRMNYHIGTGRNVSVNLFQKDCNGAITGMTIAPYTTRTHGITSDHDGLEVIIDFNKTAITSSNIWDDTDEVQFCVRVQLLSGCEVINDDKRKIVITFDFSVEFEVASVATETVNTTNVSTNVHSNDGNIKYKSKADLAASLTLALMAGIVTCAGFNCASRIGKQTQPERSSRNNNDDNIGRDNLILERNRRLSRVARLLDVIALKRDDSSLRQLAAEMRAAKLDET
ncbi:hypothetical protein ACHAW5_005887 [Stephanodiscus triporus]|uniref:Uncharacterized protein n=1 Tax=Stephanodiscus triporus TaxID=2934178 RepID=A0ABD3QVP8_9STRA